MNDSYKILENRNVNDNNKQDIPKLYENRENCCGCSACYSICPVHAILMEPDDEGFLYPTVDEAKCMRCYKCVSVCAFKTDQRNKGYLENTDIQ